MTKAIKKRFMGSLALALLVLCIILGSALWTSDPAAQSSGGYGYLHFASGCHMGGKDGVAVIDTRNGNMWCVPTDGSAPIYTGTLNLAAIPVRGPGRR